jgi:hypothetical protein
VPEIFVTDYGTPKIVADRLLESGARVDTLETVWEVIKLDLLKITETQISSGGRRGGGSYRKLQDETIRKKGNARILYTAGSREVYDRIDSDALVRSVTVDRAPFQIWVSTKDSFEFGTDRPWAFVHQYGSDYKNRPARPFLRLLPTDATKYRDMIATYILEPFDKPVEPVGGEEEL